MKYKRMLRAVFTSGIALVINCLINLILTPYITTTVGTAAYGFVSLSKQITNYATIITAALNSFAIRYIALAYHKDDMDEANVYFSSTFIGDIILATCIFLPATVLIFFAEYLLHIPEELVTDVKLLFLITMVSFWLTTVFTAQSSAAFIKDKLDIVGIFKTLSYITEASVLIVCYIFFPTKILYVGIASLLSMLVIIFSNIWICRKYTPELKITKEKFKKSAVFRLMRDGMWTSLTSLGDALNTGLDLIVCNLLLTPINMGQIAIAKTFHSLFIGLFFLVGQAFQPMFLKSYADEDKTTLLTEMRYSMKVSGMFSNIIFAGFAALGLACYKLWIPNEDVELIYMLTLINNITVIPGGTMQPLYYIYVLTLKKKVPTIITIIGGLLNVIGMYVLIKFTPLGVYSVMITTAVVMCIINFITNPLYIAHVLKFPLRTLYPNILRNVLSCAIMVLAFWGISILYTPHSWVMLGIMAIIMAIIGVIIHILVTFDRNDVKHFVSIAKNRIRRET